MTIYKWSIVVTGVVAIISIISAIIFNNNCNSFVSNIFIGVFGSSLLVFMTSIIGYIIERKKTMEGFFTEAHKYLNCIAKYRVNVNTEEKIKMLLSITDFDISPLSTFYGNMDYFFGNTIKTYAFEQIYRPLGELRKKINLKEMQFRAHLDGTGTNVPVMEKFINDIEKSFVGPTERTISGTGIKTVVIYPFLTNKIFDELNGRYYEYMYWPKRKGNSNDGEA